MAGKWQIDLECQRASFGNFVVTFRELEGRGFSLEISNAPALEVEEALEFASEAAQAIADAIRRKRSTREPIMVTS